MEERKNWKLPVILVGILLFAVVVAWVGINLLIDSFRTTDDYKQLNGIYHQYENGREYTKDELFNALGNPDWVLLGADTESGDLSQILSSDHETIALTYRDRRETFYDGTVWNYGAMRYIDPSDGWQLTILFDENDAVTYMEWKLIPGG